MISIINTICAGDICIYQSEWSSGAFRGGTDDASMQCVNVVCVAATLKAVSVVSVV